MTFPTFSGRSESCPISHHYRTFFIARQARRIWRGTWMTKRRLGLCLAMVRFDPADPFDDETPAADPLGAAPVAAPRRRSRRLAAPSFAPTNPLLEQAFPSWARPPKQPAVGADAGFEAAFRAGAGLALLDQILRARSAVRRRAAPAPGACAPRPPAPPWRAIARILPRCATPSIFRPTPAGTRPPAPPGASIGCGAFSPRARSRFDAPSLRRAADLLELPRDLRFRGARRGAAASRCRRRKSVGGGGARRFDDDANAGRRAARGNRDFGAVAERSDAGAKARLGCAGRPAGDDDRAAVVAVGGPPAAPGRCRLGRSIAPRPSRSPRGRLMGSPPIFRGDRRSC